MLKTIPNGAPTLAVVLLASVLFAHLKGCIPETPPAVSDKPTDDPPKPGPPTPPVVQPALVLTARQYRDHFGANFSAVGDRIASGELSTRDAILDALRANAQPFNESLGAAIQGACSPGGTVSDKDGLAKVFKQVGDATGGK